MAALQIATRMPFNGRTIEYGGKEGGKEPCTCVAAFSETQAVFGLVFAIIGKILVCSADISPN